MNLSYVLIILYFVPSIVRCFPNSDIFYVSVFSAGYQSTQLGLWWIGFFFLKKPVCQNSGCYIKSKITNKVLENYLRYFVCHQPHEWTNWLTLTEFWFNTSWKQSTHLTPYEILYWKKASYPTLLCSKHSKSTRSRTTFILSRHCPTISKWCLKLAQERMRKFANRKRTKRYFSVSD